MKPQFALSLSSDGISLLIRSDAGWHGLGTVGFGGDTMDAELAALRETGAERAGLKSAEQLSCKLVIPEDQIRYLTLDTGPLPQSSRRDAAAAALEGATPYAVSDLSFDIAVHGAKTHVAAVALETLQEADTFARGHGFEPICFIASPIDPVFCGEAFLGAAAALPAADVAALKADHLPVRDLGPLPEPEPQLSPLPASLPPAPPAPSPDSEADEAPLPLGLDVQVFDEDTPPSDDMPALGFSSRRNSTSTSEPAEDAEDTADASEQPHAQTAEAEASEPEASTVDADLPAAETETDAAAEPTPSTPTAESVTKALAKHIGTGAAAKTSAPAPDQATAPRPTQTSKDARAAAPTATPAAGMAPSAAPPADPSATLSAIRKAASARIPAAPSAPKTAAAPQFSRQGTTPPPAPQVTEPKAVAAAVAAASSGAAVERPSGKPAIPAALASALGTTGAATAKPIAPPEAAPAKPKAKSRALNPKHMALATVALLAVLGGALAVLPSLLQDAEQQAEIATDTADANPAAQPLVPAPTAETTTDPATVARNADIDDAIIASLPAPRLLEPTIPAAETPAPADQTVDLAPDPALPAPEAPVENAEVAEDAPRTPKALSQAAQYAATGIWQEVPKIADLPKLVSLDTLKLPAFDGGAPNRAQAELHDALKAQEFNTDQVLGDKARQTAALPAAAAAENTAVEIAAAAATQNEPQQVAADDTTPEALIANAAADAQDTVQETVPENAPALVAEATQESTQEPPAAPQLDARGLVIATVEGALTPEGVRVFKGRPDVVPPAVPDRLDAEDLAAQQAAQIAAEQRRELGRIRPRLRPAELTAARQAALTPDLSADAIAADAEAALSDAALSDATIPQAQVQEAPIEPELRPRARPATLTAIGRALQEAATTPAPDAAPEPSATLRPRARPTNFATLLRQSRERATARNTAAATVAPAIPSSASVARQATQNDVLNLRRLNLIGVYGTAANRRALVRLPSGRYVKVKVGDRIDGGRIVAIGESQLRYQKGGRNTTLEMPSG